MKKLNIITVEKQEKSVGLDDISRYAPLDDNFVICQVGHIIDIRHNIS